MQTKIIKIYKALKNDYKNIEVYNSQKFIIVKIDSENTFIFTNRTHFSSIVDNISQFIEMNKYSKIYIN